MLAGDLAAPYVYVTADDDAVTAVRLMVEHRLPALLVVDRAGWPCAVVPASALVRHLMAGRRACTSHRGRTLRRLTQVNLVSWLPKETLPALVVETHHTAHQVGEAMARAGSPLAVVAGDGHGMGRRVIGAITADRLHAALAGEASCRPQ